MTEQSGRVEPFIVYRNPAPVPEAERAAILANPQFGKKFTDHMARITWSKDEGWTDRRLVPYGPLEIDPATAVLHYAQEVFEGLKAYRHADGSIWAFRPEANAKRFQASARRLALPELSEDDFLGSIEALVAVDSAWVPGADETSLYLRPFMFAANTYIGVCPACEVEYLMIASPVGSYFAGGVQPVSIWVCEDYSRAGRGGTGAAKCGPNYAASLLPQQQAYDQGCDQVLFLDAETSSNVEELGGMNAYVVFADGTVVTPELTGTFLEGITRGSIIELLRAEGRPVVERQLPLAEVKDGLADGSIAEIFACGTAAVVTPVGRLAGPGYDLTVADGGSGKVTMNIRRQLTDIQYGRAEDTRGWMTRLL